MAIIINDFELVIEQTKGSPEETESQPAAPAEKRPDPAETVRRQLKRAARLRAH